jgi:putative protease
LGDKILIIGPTTGVYEDVIAELVCSDRPVEKAVKGDHPTIPVSRSVRRNDKVYKIVVGIDGND